VVTGVRVVPEAEVSHVLLPVASGDCAGTHGC
jgi:hypothetical protein